MVYFSDLVQYCNSNKEKSKKNKVQYCNSNKEKKSKKNNTALNNLYGSLENYLDLVVKGYSNSLILQSEAGLGKSTFVLNYLKKNKIKFSYRSGYSTPLKFYEELYELNKSDSEVIFFDDMDLLFADKKIVSLLKPALWEVNGKREVFYLSSSSQLLAPMKFNFTKKLIFAVNDLNEKDLNLKAVYSRALLFKVHLSFKDKFNLFMEVSKKDFFNLSLQEKNEVISFLRSVCNPATMNLNLRTLIKSFGFRSFGVNWKQLCLNILEFDEKLLFIFENETEPMNRLIGLFRQKFGLSQSSFYRYFEKLKKLRGVM